MRSAASGSSIPHYLRCGMLGTSHTGNLRDPSGGSGSVIPGGIPMKPTDLSIINCRCRPSMAKCRSSLHLLHITFQQHLFNKAAMARSLASDKQRGDLESLDLDGSEICTTNISIHISIDRLDWVRLDQIGFDICD